MSPEERVPTTRKVDEMIEKSSLASLYVGVILGAFMGVIGNVLVEFAFSDLTNPMKLYGLAVSVIAFSGTTWALWQQTKKYAKTTSGTRKKRRPRTKKREG